MKKLGPTLKINLVISFLLLQCYSFSQSTGGPKLSWRRQNPLSQKVFIENNNGQFDKQVPGNKKVYFKAVLKGTNIYLTDKGIIYSHIEKIRDTTEKKTKEEVPLIAITHCAEFLWKGANLPEEFIPEQEQRFYYSYSEDNKHTIIAHAYRKVLCKNLYPGVDVEYSFAPDSGQLVCSIKKHTEANSSKVSLIYNGTEVYPGNGILDNIVKTDMGEFALSLHSESDYSSTHKQESGSVRTASLDSLLWISDPGFATYDAMYDICYDNNGNVYVYGGTSPYQLAKFDSTGILKWIYTTNFIKVKDPDLYGDFVTDKTTGTSYLGEGLNETNGPEIIKVNTDAILQGTTNLGTSIYELWRMDMNYCTHMIIIGGGGIISTRQAGILDTNLSILGLYDVAGVSSGKNDVAVLTSDRGQPYCYMGLSNSNDAGPGPGNVLIKCSVPAMLPDIYMNPDNYHYEEIRSNAYVDEAPTASLSSAANGMNGISAIDSDIYMWDGAYVSRYSKNTGILINVKRINSQFLGSDGQQINLFGGIDADNCGNVYLGEYSYIDILNESLSIVSVTPPQAPSDTVYDLHISPKGKLYVCGYGFVSSYSIPESKTSIVKTVSPACSGCNGTAFVSLSGCAKGTYSWSVGSTEQFVTNLCAGTYTVDVTIDCSTIISDTVTIPPSPKPSVSIPSADVKDVSCFGENNGSAIAIASSGTPPYTYHWYPINSSNDTVTNLSAGSYTFIVTDANGCAAIDTVDIIQPGLLDAVATKSGDIHTGQTSTLSASASGGTPPYTYNWSDSLGSNPVVNVSPGTTTTYTVTVTDKDGCTATAIVTVDVLCDDVFVPDAFSPNGDGYNDYLYVKGGCITNMTFIVFDRWGNKVFETSNLNKGWDGTFNGHPMNTGTYACYLKVTLIDQTSLERKGNVTLVR